MFASSTKLLGHTLSINWALDMNPPLSIRATSTANTFGFIGIIWPRQNSDLLTVSTRNGPNSYECVGRFLAFSKKFRKVRKELGRVKDLLANARYPLWRLVVFLER